VWCASFEIWCQSFSRRRFRRGAGSGRPSCVRRQRRRLRVLVTLRAGSDQAYAKTRPVGTRTTPTRSEVNRYPLSLPLLPTDGIRNYWFARQWTLLSVCALLFLYFIWTIRRCVCTLLVFLIFCNVFNWWCLVLRGVYSDTFQLNSTDPVEHRTAKSVMFWFMTSRPTNWVNWDTTFIDRPELSWVELCRYKRALTLRTANVYFLSSTDFLSWHRFNYDVHTCRTVTGY